MGLEGLPPYLGPREKEQVELPTRVPHGGHTPPWGPLPSYPTGKSRVNTLGPAADQRSCPQGLAPQEHTRRPGSATLTMARLPPLPPPQIGMTGNRESDSTAQSSGGRRNGLLEARGRSRDPLAPLPQFGKSHPLSPPSHSAGRRRAVLGGSGRRLFQPPQLRATVAYSRSFRLKVDPVLRPLVPDQVCAPFLCVLSQAGDGTESPRGRA